MTILRSMIALAVFLLAFLSTARAEEHGAKPEHGKEAEAEPVASGPTDHYVHKWLAFPTVVGAALPAGDGQRTIGGQPGRMTVVIFLASWCEPCQQLLPRLRNLEKRYQHLAADFHYVFVHDTLDDAAGIMKEFGIDRAVLGNTEILKTFHNPDLPTIYVGDRHGWLMTRYVKAGPDAVDGLDELLKYLTAY